jgi:hypothetical protein
MIPRATMRLSQNVWRKSGTANISIGDCKSANAEAFFAWLPLLLFFALTLRLRILFSPWVFMWALAIAIFFGLQWATWWRARNSVSHSPWRAAAFLLAWPGTDAKSFLDETRHPPPPRFADWLWAILKTVLGAGLLWFVARSCTATRPLLRGWTGMIGLVFLLHFGVFHILALVWQHLGVQAEPSPLLCIPNFFEAIAPPLASPVLLAAIGPSAFSLTRFTSLTLTGPRENDSSLATSC